MATRGPSAREWDQVWKYSGVRGQYSYLDSRVERVLDKIGYFIQSGVVFDKGARVLEAGCGDGLVLLHLLRLFEIEGHGVDFSIRAKLQAERLMQREAKAFTFTVEDIAKMSYDSDYFDNVICLGVIEHFRDISIPLKELLRVLKPGGEAIVMTPNRRSAGVADRRLCQLFRAWPFGFQAEYSPRILARTLRAVGFTVHKCEAVLRRSMSNDSARFRTIGYVDRTLSLLLRNWGFYSYAYARKPSATDGTLLPPQVDVATRGAQERGR